jgi:hypothetical protein
MFPGDYPLQEALGHLLVLARYNAVCNTYSRFSEACYLFQPDSLYNFYSFMSLMGLYYNSSVYLDNPTCVQETYTKDFWYYTYMADKLHPVNPDADDKDESGDDSFAVSLVVGFWVLAS